MRALCFAPLASMFMLHALGWEGGEYMLCCSHVICFMHAHVLHTWRYAKGIAHYMLCCYAAVQSSHAAMCKQNHEIHAGIGSAKSSTAC